MVLDYMKEDSQGYSLQKLISNGVSKFAGFTGTGSCVELNGNVGISGSGGAIINMTCYLSSISLQGTLGSEGVNGAKNQGLFWGSGGSAFGEHWFEANGMAGETVSPYGGGGVGGQHMLFFL